MKTPNTKNAKNTKTRALRYPHASQLRARLRDLLGARPAGCPIMDVTTLSFAGLLRQRARLDFEIVQRRSRGLFPKDLPRRLPQDLWVRVLEHAFDSDLTLLTPLRLVAAEWTQIISQAAKCPAALVRPVSIRELRRRWAVLTVAPLHPAELQRIALAVPPAHEQDRSPYRMGEEGERVDEDNSVVRGKTKKLEIWAARRCHATRALATIIVHGPGGATGDAASAVIPVLAKLLDECGFCGSAEGRCNMQRRPAELDLCCPSCCERDDAEAFQDNEWFIRRGRFETRVVKLRAAAADALGKLAKNPLSATCALPKLVRMFASTWRMESPSSYTGSYGSRPQFAAAIICVGAHAKPVDLRTQASTLMTLLGDGGGPRGFVMKSNWVREVEKVHIALTGVHFPDSEGAYLWRGDRYDALCKLIRETPEIPAVNAARGAPLDNVASPLSFHHLVPPGDPW